MATLEKRADKFRVIFRLAGKRFARSLKTRHEKEAIATLARLEDNLRRVELGILKVPDFVDVDSFLLSDRRLTQKPTAPAPKFTLSLLFQTYFEKLPNGALEASTIQCMIAVWRTKPGPVGRFGPTPFARNSVRCEPTKKPRCFRGFPFLAG